MNNLSSIVLFVYNRPWHTRQTIEALQKNKFANESEIFIYSDGAKNESAQKSVDEVREYIKTVDGFKKVSIIEREKNWGLANNIIDGVTKIVNEYGKVIVLEDDLVTSPYFLEYMNKALDIYEKDNEVISVHGYIYPVKEELPESFFIKGADCWGWATWKRGWDLFEEDGKKLLMELKQRKLTKEFNFNNSFDYTKMLKYQISSKNNSWAVRWYASAFLKNKLTLYPGESLVKNIGFDGSGVHCGGDKAYEADLVDSSIDLEDTQVKEDLVAKKIIENFLRDNKIITYKKVINKFKQVWFGLLKK